MEWVRTVRPVVSEHPTHSYLICTTPRSGSTLLCELLEETGVAGRPDEYFQQLRATGMPMTPRDYLEGVAADVVPPSCDAHGKVEEFSAYDPRRFTDFEQYVAWVRRRATTPNGVFAAKIMWPYMAGLVDGLSTIPRHRGTEAPHELLADAFPGLRHVWLRRLDKVRQAVSLWRAIQTWSWRQDATQGCEQARTVTLRYSFDAIDHLRRRLIASDRAWEIYFDATQLEPLTLTYENFVPRMHETVEQLLDHVGVTCLPGEHYCAPRTARQSDEVSEQWVAEFRAEFDGRVPAVG
jgi:LPS sulfotransferase NodH